MSLDEAGNLIECISVREIASIEHVLESILSPEEGVYNDSLPQMTLRHAQTYVHLLRGKLAEAQGICRREVPK